MAIVTLSVDARRDLRAYRGWLRREAGAATADRWIEALLDWMDALRDFSERGTPRPDLGPEMRTRVFRRSVTIAYVSKDEAVTILRILARGREITADLFIDDR